MGSRHPRALLQYLTEERKYTVAQPVPGIYIITGDYLPIQIIESPLLPKSENLWLKSLGSGLKAESMRTIIAEAGNDHKRAMYLGVYLDIILRANRETFMEVQNMAKSYPTYEEVLIDAGLTHIVEKIREKEIDISIEEGEARAKKKIARNLLALGMSVNKIASAAELPIEQVRALKKNAAQ
ncbi:MAG: hypothetical protein LBC99_03210 [Spirochaetota bacterium]|nr:hypothetical protein [Spirochaetota bacterium]